IDNGILSGGEDALPFFLHACPHIEWSDDGSTRSMGNAMRFSEAPVKRHTSLRAGLTGQELHEARNLVVAVCVSRLDQTPLDAPLPWQFTSDLTMNSKPCS